MMILWLVNCCRFISQHAMFCYWLVLIAWFLAPHSCLSSFMDEVVSLPWVELAKTMANKACFICRHDYHDYSLFLSIYLLLSPLSALSSYSVEWLALLILEFQHFTQPKGWVLNELKMQMQCFHESLTGRLFCWKASIHDHPINSFQSA